jgi:integrase
VSEKFGHFTGLYSHWNPVVPHYPQPFFRADRSLWYVQTEGKQHNLGRDRDEAFRRYHQLMQAPKPVESKLAVGVIDGFLDWTKDHRAPRTFDWYEDHLQSFVDSLPDKRIKTNELRPFHVHQWIDAHPTWGPSYRRGAIVAVQRAFLWAEKLGHIDRSPIRHIEKPEAERRDNPISPEDFTALLAQVKDGQFRDLLSFAWESGIRPQEGRAIEIRHVDLAHKRIAFPPNEAKGKKRWRVIRLTDAAVDTVRRRISGRKEGRVFLNVDGNPWKNYAICNRFTRLKKKLGKRFAMYDLRHSFATRKLTEGADHLTVAELLGHANGQMLATVYQHLNKHEDHLMRALNGQH